MQSDLVFGGDSGGCAVSKGGSDGSGVQRWQRRIWYATAATTDLVCSDGTDGVVVQRWKRVCLLAMSGGSGCAWRGAKRSTTTRAERVRERWRGENSVRAAR
ncbi:hypothetical protein Scep_014220 [Stephania cephalantha]|uniref:Uncharacterized protein n=1 Tax=Stephania cephalantha TaxID=152367 RepID=A0AAP0J0U9_9MAGN